MAQRGLRAKTQRDAYKALGVPVERYRQFGLSLTAEKASLPLCPNEPPSKRQRMIEEEPAIKALRRLRPDSYGVFDLTNLQLPVSLSLSPQLAPQQPPPPVSSSYSSLSALLPLSQPIITTSTQKESAIASSEKEEEQLMFVDSPEQQFQLTPPLPHFQPETELYLSAEFDSSITKLRASYCSPSIHVTAPPAGPTPLVFTAEENHLFATILRTAAYHAEEIQGELISGKSIQTLLHPQGWLDDAVVNGYFELLQRRNDEAASRRRAGVALSVPFASCYFFNCFLYTKIHSQGAERAMEAFVTSPLRKGIMKSNPFMDYDFVLIPHNKSGTHWTLSVIHLGDNIIDYYDSLGTPGESSPVAVINLLNRAVKLGYLPKSSAGKWVTNVRSLETQSNGSDCGVFMCRIAECIGRAVSSDTMIGVEVIPSNMHGFRKLMLLELLCSKLFNNIP